MMTEQQRLDKIPRWVQSFFGADRPRSRTLPNIPINIRPPRKPRFKMLFELLNDAEKYDNIGNESAMATILEQLVTEIRAMEPKTTKPSES